MKHTILIADDEPLERRGVELLLKRHFPEAKIIADIANGLQLLEMGKNLSPDLIIADIEMPGMTGLEALNRLAEAGCEARLIIMTAYGSYQYAKEALALRVFAYLEKPARREKIVQTVKAALEEIEAERSLSDEMQSLRAYIDRMRPALMSEWMTGIETDTVDSAQLSEYAGMLGIAENGGFILTCQVQGEAPGTALKQSVARLRVFEALRAAMEAQGWIPGHVVNQTLACCVFQPSEKTNYQNRILAVESANRLYSNLPEDMQGRVRIGVGAWKERAEQLSASYRESLRALYVRDSLSPINHFDDVTDGPLKQNPFARLELQLADSVCQSDLRACENQLRKAFGGIGLDTSPEELKDGVTESMICLRHHLAEVIPLRKLDACMPPALREQIAEARNAVELEAIYVDLCRKLTDCVKEQNQSRVAGIVEQAKQFVGRHYREDISLERTAEVIGVSQYYLSRLFKAELNVNFSAYLTELRIRKACAYLDGSDLSIKEISDRTGFSNPDYFGKVFKKQMGCTVTEYRMKRQ